MSATLTPVTMAPVKMASPPSPATATWVTLAACVRLTSMSVLASPARMVALVRTGRTHIFVPAQKALQVRHLYDIQMWILPVKMSGIVFVSFGYIYANLQVLIVR